MKSFRDKYPELFDAEFLALHAEELAANSLAFVLLDAMKEQGLSKDDLAKELGIDRSVLGQVLDGEDAISFKTAARIAHWLGRELKVDPKHTEAVDRFVRENLPESGKTVPLKPREKTLRELQAAIHDLAREKGWWDGHQGFSRVLPDGTLSDVRLDMSTDQLLAKVSLIHAELSEAVEEARKSNDHGMYLGEGGKPEGFVVELADAVIRTLDLCGALGLDLEAAIVAKHEFNKTRPRRHGGKLA